MLISNINGINSEKYFFICNDFNKGRDNALISSKTELKFSVNEYIDHMDHYDNLKYEDYAKNAGIQRVAFLVM